MLAIRFQQFTSTEYIAVSTYLSLSPSKNYNANSGDRLVANSDHNSLTTHFNTATKVKSRIASWG